MANLCLATIPSNGLTCLRPTVDDEEAYCVAHMPPQILWAYVKTMLKRIDQLEARLAAAELAAGCNRE